MKFSSVSVSMAAVALLAGGVALWPANAQPTGDKPAGGGQPPAGGRPNGGGGQRGGGRPQSPWAEKFRDELREHPSLGRALVSLHDAKDYLDTVKGDLGGHKKATMDSIDASIKEITEAIKFDEKAPPRDRPGRGGGDAPGDKPAGDKPATTTPPAPPAKP